MNTQKQSEAELLGIPEGWSKTHISIPRVLPTVHRREWETHTVYTNAREVRGRDSTQPICGSTTQRINQVRRFMNTLAVLLLLMTIWMIILFL